MMDDSSTVGTPLPQPTFYMVDEHPSFSTKKERHNRLDGYPSKPSVKSAYSTCRSRKYTNQGPHVVSFKSNPDNSIVDTLSARYYDDRIRESYFQQAFIVESTLGQGSFGEVFKARKRCDGRLYAVKRAKEIFRNEVDRCIKTQEVSKHETLPPHANLVRFYSAWEERGRLYIQTELCDRSLSQEIDMRHEIPESTVWKYLIDLLMGVKHLHNFGLIHLDIKPENVLVSRDGICKLADFGLVFDLNNERVDEAREGDSKYLAPEILEYGQFGKPADIFSLGILVLEVSTDLDLPTRGVEWQLLRQGLPEDLATTLSVDMRSVVSAMIHPDPAVRPTATGLLQSETIKNKTFARSIYVAYRSGLNGFFDGLWSLWLMLYNWMWMLVPETMKHTSNNERGRVHSRCNAGSTSPALGNTPTADQRLARPLRFEMSFSEEDDDGFEDDHQVRDLSPIRNLSPLLDSSAHSPIDKSFDGCDDSSIDHPCNSTPAQSDFRPRRRLIPRSPAITTPLIQNLVKRTVSRNSSFTLDSPSVLRSSSRNHSSRKSSKLAPCSPGGDSVFNVSKFRLALDAHGSSSDDEM